MKAGYIILIFLFCGHLTYSQSQGLNLNKLFPIKHGTYLFFNPKKEMVHQVSIHHSTYPPSESPYINPYRYQDELGFFCKVELKWDKKLIRPFRFRLGSYEYVNRLEGK